MSLLDLSIKMKGSSIHTMETELAKAQTPGLFRYGFFLIPWWLLLA